MTAALVTAVLRQPASCGQGTRPDFRQRTFDYVPGSVLRGALAAMWLRTPGTPRPNDPRFREVFEGSGSFGPLHSLDSLPIPLSVMLHKTGAKPGCATPWWDAAYGEGTDGDQCPDCGGTLEQSKGQPVGDVATVTRTRAALDDDGVAIDRMLFRRSSIAAGTELRGWVTGPAVAALSPGGADVTTLRFGGERSVRGLAEISVQRNAAPPAAEMTDGNVVLRLAAPGLFLDRFGLPADRPGKAELKKALGVQIKAVEVEPGWVRWTEAGGWHMASGLPKPRERAVAPGSTYRVVCSQKPDNDRLTALMIGGIGLRRREGFGALCPRPRDWITDVSPITGWSKWGKMLPRLSQKVTALSLGNVDDRLGLAVTDPTLSAAQQRALKLLLSITDAHHLEAILNRLAS